MERQQEHRKEQLVHETSNMEAQTCSMDVEAMESLENGLFYFIF